MKANQLLKEVIRPTLEKIGLADPVRERLILGTACVESNCGDYIRQFPSGPAYGIYQMEMATARDIMNNYLAYRLELKAKIMALYCEGITDTENYVGNLFFATAMCAVHYLRQPAVIPGTIAGMAEYWKKYYNTVDGKGTPDKFIKAYERHINGKS